MSQWHPGVRACFHRKGQPPWEGTELQAWGTGRPTASPWAAVPARHAGCTSHSTETARPSPASRGQHGFLRPSTVLLPWQRQAHVVGGAQARRGPRRSRPPPSGGGWLPSVAHALCEDWASLPGHYAKAGVGLDTGWGLGGGSLSAPAALNVLHISKPSWEAPPRPPRGVVLSPGHYLRPPLQSQTPAPDAHRPCDSTSLWGQTSL